ncbi:MAG: ubiquitin [Bacillota bacterium]|nr:ubiquitin [Bacillota bacterium]
MTNLEQAEKLREKVNVTYDEAKAALEATGGDLLEALIYLERNGKVRKPVAVAKTENTGYYSTAGGANSANSANSANGASGANSANGANNCGQASGTTFADLVKSFAFYCKKIIKLCLKSNFVVFKGDRKRAEFPTILLILFSVFAFWITIPVMLLGVLCGFSYRFI